MKSCICDNMDGLRGYYAEWNKSNNNINTVWIHLRVEFNKQYKWTNITKLKQTHREQTGGCHMGGDGGRGNIG